ncbi:hypothetical protein P5E81_15085, partial [Clostridium perfringens]|nr:hypothetical protein [Clostridium perfringens]
IRRRLKRTLIADTGEEIHDIVKKKIFSDVPFLNQILSTFPGVDRLELLMRQANVKYTMGFFVLLSATLGLIGYVILFIFTKNPVFSMPLGFS